MFMSNPIFDSLKQTNQNQQFDGIKEAVEQVAFDPIDERMAITQTANMRMAAVSVVLNTTMILSEGQDEEDELLPNEVLDGLIEDVFVEDDEDDDEVVDETVKAQLTAFVMEALIAFGVKESVISDMFNTDTDVADTAIEKACETVLENLPDDGEPLDEFLNAYIFGVGIDEEDSEEGFDGVGSTIKKLFGGKTSTQKIGGKTFRYKAEKVIKNGKAVFKNVRVGGGHVKLSAKQKAALKKAQRKAQLGSAVMKRVKSFKKGFKLGLHDR